MGDLIFLAVSIVFFVGSVLYALGCESLKNGRDNA
jgi:hypothetical protein